MNDDWRVEGDNAGDSVPEARTEIQADLDAPSPLFAFLGRFADRGGTG